MLILFRFSVYRSC